MLTVPSSFNQDKFVTIRDSDIIYPQPQHMATHKKSANAGAAQVSSFKVVNNKTVEKPVEFQLHQIAKVVSFLRFATGKAIQNIDSNSNEAKPFDGFLLSPGTRRPGQLQSTKEMCTSTTVNEAASLSIKLLGWDLDCNMDPASFNQGIFDAAGKFTNTWGVDFAPGYDW